ncbi:MAG: 3-ketoacyl-ACP reductase [Spirochaetaceae bacterium]|nr:3-ketoacyl-ACP reductase [Spirochaetaceae bacterium]
MNSKPVALVTGGSRGIGLGVCESLASEGYDLFLCGRRSADQVVDILVHLKDLGAEVGYAAADISSSEDRSNLIDGVYGRFGRLDVLVNNAGMAPRKRADILDASEEIYDEVMNVNLKGPYFLTQAVARRMAESRRNGADPDEQAPTIIFITSVSVTAASPNRGEYCISKAGLAMAASLWAVRLAEFGINVYEIRPGVIATDMTSGVKEKYNRLIADGLTLQPRWGTPRDVGKAVASLAGGDWPYSTGGAIYVDGGMSVPRF